MTGTTPILQSNELWIGLDVQGINKEVAQYVPGSIVINIKFHPIPVNVLWSIDVEVCYGRDVSLPVYDTNLYKL